MREILDFLFLVLLFYFVYTFAFYTQKRVVAASQINSLKKVEGAEVRFLRNPFASYFKLSKNPDAVVTVGESIYVIRLINGKGGLRFLHFASAEYFVTYSKIRISISGLLRFGRHRADISESTSRRSVKILPQLEIPEEYKKKAEIYGKKLIPVLIFSPVPNEVTFVSETKTSIKVAFSGDEIYGQKVFTPRNFATYAERMKREEEYLKRKSEGFEYF